MTYFIAVRPGLIEFLEEMQKYYVLNVYTCSDIAYAEAILTKIGARSYFQKLFTRIDCKKGKDRVLSKDLSVVGIDLCDVILIDDLDRHVDDNKANSLRISEFVGGKLDEELKRYARFLKKVAFCQDVRSISEKFQSFQEGKQFVFESDFLVKESVMNSPVKFQTESLEKGFDFEDEELTLQLAEEHSPKFVRENEYPEIFFRSQATTERSCVLVSA
eukprot:CAMPEP_0176467690 /NCGR_PEP_ID=MMETSP0127-20121128/38601_1 /TAXON_ID=938130 /ORGANISM="Platyophrya macrostoma, Strain WH" /LENGTH=216 /DNA_ID=CAMNT_0017861023 /DNA_START=298 /DNA_END=948 /DNA_ORIENTATION=+